MAKVNIHTVDQTDSDTTTFVLSCNRLDVLDKTLQTFYATRDYVTKMVIVDDSAEPGVFETLVERYGEDCDVICFPRNRSQWWAMDFMVSYCDSDYIFYLEDDWELTQPGYLNKSKTILQKYREVGVVDISWRTFEFQGIDSYEKKLIDGEF
jgi:GT2 family glycosyltransferase